MYKQLNEVLSLLAGDLSYDSRAKAKDIIKQIIANEYAKNVSMSKRLRGR